MLLQKLLNHSQGVLGWSNFTQQGYFSIPIQAGAWLQQRPLLTISPGIYSAELAGMLTDEIDANSSDMFGASGFDELWLGAADIGCESTWTTA